MRNTKPSRPLNFLLSYFLSPELFGSSCVCLCSGLSCELKRRSRDLGSRKEQGHLPLCLWPKANSRGSALVFEIKVVVSGLHGLCLSLSRLMGENWCLDKA